jgi:hypothetical protein
VSAIERIRTMGTRDETRALIVLLAFAVALRLFAYRFAPNLIKPVETFARPASF